MKENEISKVLMDKLIELNELEILKAKILAALFQKTTNEMMENKIKTLESNFEGQAKYYGQYVEDYENTYTEIILKYKEQLIQIFDKYNEFYINMCLELQEAECNQKIAIANIKNSYEIREQIQGKIKDEIVEEYNKKISACLEKKKNYDFMIYQYEKNLSECLDEMQEQINEIFTDKSNLMSLQEEGIFERLINKIKNLFTGKTNFKLYVIQPLNVELDTIDGKLLGITNAIQQETVNFVARSKQAKDEINLIYENMS